MSGIVKNCVQCKKPFHTMSTSTNENRCRTCWMDKKQDIAIRRSENKQNNVILSIEKRLDALERYDFAYQVEMKVNTMLQHMMPTDLEKMFNDKLDKYLREHEKKLRELREKQQKQISILHTRIQELEKEVESLYG